MPAIIRHIEDLNIPELQTYTRLNEPQLKHYYEPDLGLFIAEGLNVIDRALAAGYEASSFLVEERFVPTVQALLEKHGIADLDPVIYTAPLDTLIQIVGFNLTGGILCLMKRMPLPSPDDICRGARRIVVLENVTNPTNVGAIFRSAAALGMQGILLTATSCDPLYRRAVRVSMGTVFQIPWTFLPAGHTEVLRYVNKEEGIYRKEDALYTDYWPEQGFAFLKERGFATVSLALTDQAVPIHDPSIPTQGKLALILGNEGYGLLDETIRKSDYTAIIPMSNGVDSLNVAAASAVAFWQLR